MSAPGNVDLRRHWGNSPGNGEGNSYVCVLALMRSKIVVLLGNLESID